MDVIHCSIPKPTALLLFGVSPSGMYEGSQSLISFLTAFAHISIYYSESRKPCKLFPSSHSLKARCKEGKCNSFSTTFEVNRVETDKHFKTTLYVALK
jgi:hypothetical protein